MIRIARPQVGEEEKQAVLEVLDSGTLAHGQRVRAFEEAFAEMCGVAYAVATSSGTAALHTALLAHGIGPGDEVITSPFTFIATANSILYCGARPAFVDIDSLTYNLDPALIEHAITPRTKAILPVHLYGLSCDMDSILAIAEKHDLKIIEDACQGHGAAYKGRRLGSFGTGIFSLYATKNITSGEGGMITTCDPAIAEKCRAIRNHGFCRRNYQDILGFNYWMSDLHAAVGLAQLHKLERFNQTRQVNAAYLDANLQGVIKPYTPLECQHVFHQYTVRVQDGQRDALLAYLLVHGVGAEVYYPVPVHQQTYYKDFLGYTDRLPVAERAAAEVLSLPVHAGLCQDDLATIVAVMGQFDRDRESRTGTSF